MSFALLAAEIGGDPLGRDYASMTDQQVVDDLNTKYRSRARQIIPAYEVIEATVPAEYAALSADEKQRYQIFISAGQINVEGANTRSAFAAMFGPATTTRSNLLALQNEFISRGVEIGHGVVRLGEVKTVRGT